MIRENYFKNVGNEEKAKYQFPFCEGCNFYPCERKGEFHEYIRKHPENVTIRDRKTDIVLKTGLEEMKKINDNYTISATAISYDEYERENREDQNMQVPRSVLSADEYERQNESSIVEERYYSNRNSFSYDNDEMKNGCFMGPRYVAQVECGIQRVTDGVGDHYKIEIEDNYKIKVDSDNRWEPSQPVIISAQTGQGKNYFIENKLIPYVDDLNYKNQTKQKVLILSNRLALKKQIQNRIEGNEGMDEDDGESIYSYKENVKVMTYQGILNKERHFKRIQRGEKSKYIFVICDEAHFFTSDAMFNPDTDKILQTITAVFGNAIRVYMTATPYDCLEHILQYEKSMPVFYHFRRDYSYLDIFTYSQIEELYEIILNSIARKEKWLIFLDDKKGCEGIKDALKRKAEGMYSTAHNVNIITEKFYAVNAESKKDEKYLSMVKDEKLGEDICVLITTSVLDNGVNLRDVDNIIVGDMMQAKCLQMVGRARVNDKYEKKTLYLKRFDKKYVSDRICDLKQQKSAYHAFELAYGDVNELYYQRRTYDEYKFFSKYYEGKEKDWKNAKHWFRYLPENLNQPYYNLIARNLMEKCLFRYEFIYQEMEGEQENVDIYNQGTRNLQGQKYLEYQISWFGKKYCADNDVTLCEHGKAEKKFLDFLYSYADNAKRIDKEAQTEFRDTFTKLYDVAFGRRDRNKGRQYGLNVMNDGLKEKNINYKVVSHSSHWVVEIYNWEKEDLE